MTENMAARGEGLKELDAISDLLHEHAVGLRSTNALRAREIGVLASRLDRAQVMLETALEVAAAKASMRSRSVVCDEIQTPHSYAICSCTQGHRNAQPALATPSPQAPAIESFVDNMPVVTVTGGAPPGCTADAIARAGWPQEQPAGSADFGHETNHACEHGIFTSENHCEKCDPGSPRKVGEDGASELKVGDSVRVSGIVESISTDGTLIKVDFGMGEYCYPNRLLLHPRSSSVPVGEQK